MLVPPRVINIINLFFFYKKSQIIVQKYMTIDLKIYAFIFSEKKKQKYAFFNY